MNKEEKAVGIGCGAFFALVVAGLFGFLSPDPSYESPQKGRIGNVVFEFVDAYKHDADNTGIVNIAENSDLIAVRVQVDGHSCEACFYRPNIKLVDGQGRLYEGTIIEFLPNDDFSGSKGNGLYKYQFVVEEETRLSDYKLVIQENTRKPAYLELVS